MNRICTARVTRCSLSNIRCIRFYIFPNIDISSMANIRNIRFGHDQISLSEHIFYGEYSQYSFWTQTKHRRMNTIIQTKHRRMNTIICYSGVQLTINSTKNPEIVLSILNN